MYQLKKAEEIDNFFEQVKESPINQKARENLSYFPTLNYTIPFLDGTQIVLMHPTAEAGMPHTRPPNIICMPKYYPESKQQETLVHEFIHIHQRKHKAKWDTFFQKEGWHRADPFELPEYLYNRCRMNPDTIDQPFWAWKDRHIPLPLFEREDKPDLRQVVIHWYDKETGRREAEAPRSFLEKYGSPSQPEHPREIAAVELAPRFKNVFDIDDYLKR